MLQGLALQQEIEMTDDETKALLKAILHELTEHMIPLEVACGTRNT